MEKVEERMSQIEEISMQKLEEIKEYIKIGKAVGEDNIESEFLKWMGEERKNDYLHANKHKFVPMN